MLKNPRPGVVCSRVSCPEQFEKNSGSKYELSIHLYQAQLFTKHFAWNILFNPLDSLLFSVLLRYN